MTKTGDTPLRDEALSEFWASHMEDLRVSLPRHRVVMLVRVSKRLGDDPTTATRKMLSWYELAFEGVTRFVFDDSGPEPWRVVELEEIGMRRAEGGTEYWFDLTGNVDALCIVCEDVRVTFVRSEEVNVKEKW